MWYCPITQAPKKKKEHGTTSQHITQLTLNASWEWFIFWTGLFLTSQMTHIHSKQLRAHRGGVWHPEQDEAFTNVKLLITDAPILTFYDVSMPTEVSVDVSSYGLGRVLLQDHSRQLRSVACCSHIPAEAGIRHAQIEKQSAVWACEMFSKFLCGLDSHSHWPKAIHWLLFLTSMTLMPYHSTANDCSLGWRHLMQKQRMSQTNSLLWQIDFQRHTCNVLPWNRGSFSTF